MNSDPKEDIAISPCGIYCKACPAFNKSCMGCSSSEKKQQRASKWKCRIRNCCYEIKKLEYCGYCDSYPCKMLKHRLIASHKEDNRYDYRHDIPNGFNVLIKKGFNDFVKYHEVKWRCPECNGTIMFYTHKCSTCGYVQ